MDVASLLWWNMRDVAIGGGVVGLRHNILNKEWAEKCGVEYTPATVNNESKIHGVAESGEACPTVERGVQRRETRGVPYAE